jgi:hypothetical protein
MHRQKDVGRRFPHLHAEALDVVGQPRQRVLDPVLREHLRDVQVGADPECHRHREFAVARGLAVHVQHVLDAVDLLFERRRHRARDGLRGRPWIGGRYLDRGRNDFRILRHRKDRERAQARQGDEHAQHRCENGTVDEGSGKVHVQLLY